MAVKRCPMCRKVNPDSAQRCDCSYEFGQAIPDVLQQLAHQQSIGWLQLALGLVSLGLFVAFIVAAVTGGTRVVLGVMFVIGGVRLITRGTGKVLRSRRSARELAALTKLPAARVVER